jgi:hypothetical protein
MRFLSEVFVKCFELHNSKKFAFCKLLRCAARTTQPQKKTRKKRQKKEKRKPLFQVVKPWDVKVFGKNTTYCKRFSLLTNGDIGGDFLQNAF